MPRTLAKLISEIPEHLRNTAITRSGKGSPETAQAWIRLGIVPFLIIYALYAVSLHQQEALSQHLHKVHPALAGLDLQAFVVTVLMGSLIASVAILYSTIVRPQASRTRRLLTYLHDYTALGIVLLLSEHTMSLFWVPVIWVSIGNGIRFGLRDVIISSALGLFLVFLIWTVSPSWGAHPELLLLVAAFQLLVPLYVAMMFLQRANEQSRQHQAQLEAETTRLLAMASIEADQARALSDNIDRHRSTLVALTRELQDPAIAIRNLLIRQHDNGLSKDIIRQADLILSSIATIQDIDAIVEGQIDLTPADMGASVFASTLVDKLKLVASGPITHGFEDEAESGVRLRLDARWAQNAIYSICRGIVSTAPRGQSFHLQFEIDWQDKDRGAAYLTVTLRSDSAEPEAVQAHPDVRIAHDLGRRLVELLGGRYATNIAGDLLAQVEIPVIASKPAQSGRLSTSSGVKPKIIVVDDNKTVLHTFTLYAQKLGYHPIPILHPERVPEKVEELKPAFVFIDRHMPNLSGAQLVERITSMGLLDGAQVVLFSSEADEEAYAEAKRLGVRFVPKPLRLETLRELVGTPILK